MESQKSEWVAWPVAWSAVWAGTLTLLALGLILLLFVLGVGH
jgi:hypothetical protein